MGRTYSAKRRTLLKIGKTPFLTARERCGFEPGTCKSTRRGARLKEFYFQIFKLNGFSFSIGAQVLPVQFNLSVN
jgi:hypothetical protein